MEPKTSDELIEKQLRMVLSSFESSVASGSNAFTIGSILEGLVRYFGDKSLYQAKRKNFVSKTIQSIFKEIDKTNAAAKVAAQPLIPENNKDLQKLFQKKRQRPPSKSEQLQQKKAKTTCSFKISLSANFIDFFGPDVSCRAEIIQKLVEYIRKHELQSKTDPRIVICDQKLSKLLGCERITLFGLCKYLRAALPRASTGYPKGSAAGKLLVLSEKLEDMLKIQRMTRSEVLKLIWKYIKANSLQAEHDKRLILCEDDERMKEIFQTSSLLMNEMNSSLSEHLERVDIDQEPLLELIGQTCKDTIASGALYRFETSIKKDSKSSDVSLDTSAQSSPPSELVKTEEVKDKGVQDESLAVSNQEAKDDVKNSDNVEVNVYRKEAVDTLQRKESIISTISEEPMEHS